MNPQNLLSTIACLGGIFALGLPGHADASSYGTLTNFDTVNDTGEEPHGFEIELEDCHSSDITRTYNYNHYGVPKITEDASVLAHPRCFIRWEAKKLGDGSWSAFTSVPAGPIDPTNGHQFTNPNVNFGGEHFGVSYRTVPSNARYFWLIDRGGELVRGAEEVKIATPTFTYNPVGGVVARVDPPEPVEIHVDEFGPAIWVKSIKTTTHNNHRVELRDLRSDDPDDDNDVNWRNGEPDEIEVEWEILQEEFNGEGDGMGDPLEGGGEPLEEGDEIVTRRWEFFEYIGPVDPENGEAFADQVNEDDIHGVGEKLVAGKTWDLENTVVVGDYLGAQMAAFDADPEVELCDLLQDGEVGEAYPDRTVVFGGNVPFTASGSGDLPDGMSFNAVSGLLSGTPTESGEFAFTVEASDANTPVVSRTYNLRVAAAGIQLAPQWTVDAGLAAGTTGGTVSGTGSFSEGEPVMLIALSAPGYRFYSWTELGILVSKSAQYGFPASVNRQLVANFHPIVNLSKEAGGQFVIEWPADAAGWVLQESQSLEPEDWAESTLPVTEVGGKSRVTMAAPSGGSRFFRLMLP